MKYSVFNDAQIYKKLISDVEKLIYWGYWGGVFRENLHFNTKKLELSEDHLCY